ncbi:MAG: diacylglycerol kinase family lipid kinase [Phormidesmis sp. CAN_BIN36]|nr:diacylglycerol kinase family lipid kinase [Phormidesmis sp. CAN_BIN36]
MGSSLPFQPRVLILFNPTAGQSKNLIPALESAADRWRDHGWQVNLRPTRSAGDATDLAREAAAQGYAVVVAAGGDGTVNEVVNGLVGTQTALAVLPIGTVNIWAREMGLPMDLQRSAIAFLQARLKQIDVGQAGERYFLLMAGVGFDAAVTAKIRSSEKKRLGAIAYLIQALQLAQQFKGLRADIRIDGKRIRGRILMVVIGNSQLYGGVVKLTAHAVLNDGLLDVCVIKGRNMWTAPLRLLSILLRQYDRDTQVNYYRARQVQVLGQKVLPVQVDGDYLGVTPMTFQVVPKSLWVLVPPSADRSLWQPG